MNIYYFCEENLSNYEKTMLRLAISFGATELYVLEEDDIVSLASLLKLEYNKLEKALLVSYHDIKNCTALKFGNEIYEGAFHYEYSLFDVIVRYHFISKALSQISNQIDKMQLKKNIELFESMLYHFDIINSKSATFECMYNNCFSQEFTIYFNSDFKPMDIINLLKLFLISSEYYENYKDMLPVIYQLLCYEFYTRTNTLYLITIVQIIKHSPFYDKSICDIADEFYSNLLFMHRNARVISIQINSLTPTMDFKPELRTKKDNTTRMQVLYGYDNYDTYVVRLDLAHMGEGFVHYNNKSPGGNRCCLFNEDEYLAIIEKHPELVKCFIVYGDRWSLKERTNCNLSKEEKKLYERIRKDKEHDPIFNKTYAEQNIMYFIELIGNVLPQYCYVPIDREEIHARYCFNFDKIMGGVFCLYLAYLMHNEKEIEAIIDFITSIAVNYKVIPGSDKRDYSCIDGICIIIESAKSRIPGLM